MNSKLKIIRTADWVFPAAAVFVLLLTCIASATRVRFWFDELLSYYLLSDPSFSHMLSAQYDLINTTPPLYFILTWPLAQIFGAGELPLRVFSSIGICTALLLTWHLLRRLYGQWPAAIAVSICFLSSHTVRFQNMEARLYGLFLTEIAAAVSLAVFISAKRPVHRGWLIAIALVHAMLVTTHYFGFLYSGAILLAMILSRRHEQREWIHSAAAVLTGWLAFIPCLPMFFHHLDFNKPHGWIPPPKLSDLFDLVKIDMKSTLLGGIALAALAYALRRWFPLAAPSAKQTADTDDLRTQRRTAWITMLMLLLVPIGVWIISRLGAPVFVARYFLSDVLVWSFLYAVAIHLLLQYCQRAAQACTDVRRAKLLFWLPRLALGSIGILYLALPTVKTIAQMNAGKLYKRTPMPPAMIAELAKYQVPIVLEDTLEFLPQNYYSNSAEQFFCILDREAALDAKADRGANTLDQIGSALKRHYPDLPLITTQDLLSHYDRFIVCDVDWLRWYELTIEGRDEYQCEMLSIESPAAAAMGIHPVLVQNTEAPQLSNVTQNWRRR